jgi:hypothetical protein
MPPSSPSPDIQELLHKLDRELGPELQKMLRRAELPGEGSFRSRSAAPSPLQNRAAGSASRFRMEVAADASLSRAPSLSGATSLSRAPSLSGATSLSGAASQRDARLRHATGLPEIDPLIGGGFPIGCLSEVSGPISSGRTTVVFALLAQITRKGGHVAWVDLAHAFDPPSAEAAGVVLERVLWVRAPKTLAALRCTERILETEGFALAVLDLTQPSSDFTSGSNSHRTLGRRSQLESIPKSAWLRLTRLVAAKRNTLVLLSDQRLAGSQAALALEMQPAIAHFTGSPALLETLETRALVTRQRTYCSPPEEEHQEQERQAVARTQETGARGEQQEQLPLQTREKSKHKTKVKRSAASRAA